MLTYSERAKLCVNLTAKRLLQLMDDKQTNLALAADVTTKKELLQIASELGPHICVLKTHIDIIEDFDTELITKLQRLWEKHNFLIFEDRKFADIGNTVKEQYQGGIYHIADWAHITNAHTVPGPGIIHGLKEIGLPKNRGLLLLAEMSSKGTLAQGEYTQKTIQMALDNKDFVIGFITTRQIIEDPCFINFTPGVQLAAGNLMLLANKNPTLLLSDGESIQRRIPLPRPKNIALPAGRPTCIVNLKTPLSIWPRRLHYPPT
ncbi:MAG: Orotidine 5'-phosphate decarboxylase [Candidatus Magasanikbacteria bacterium GW2011_GWC2_41_17]|uniref:Orotidine 5'-phosphate decarboxylase n=1 Tax=Candidatus Magasanikbacteria bacterium GW2011_GWC2_41_17 TaxID=1619048 RepID=A0A0G0VE08_9BACT|nr:MAG: Orotidine 5'-phosphate decarboxylase [Candidatus Magasanikbacteria bacterium GW2011_GWC2_41_17]